MKVYAVDASVSRPKIDYSRYDHNNAQKENDDYLERVKNWLLSIGYTGPNTGRMLYTPYADGSAIYMLAESSNKRSAVLVHIDIGDGWDNPLVNGLTKKAVMDLIARGEKFNKIWNSL